MTSPTLSTGKYILELGPSGFKMFELDEEGEKIARAIFTDLDFAMKTVEGLILVDHKRLEHPESAPKITTEIKEKIKPPFLKV